MKRLLVLAVLWAFSSGYCFADDRVLTLTFGGEERRLTAEELLARPDVTDLKVPDDVAYRRDMTYRAVPLLSVLGGAIDEDFHTIEARASDGFVTQIPSEVVKRGAQGGAVAWIAVEDPAKPWPLVPNRDVNAGPFYLVWQDAKLPAISEEYWPFALVALSAADDPVKRWPALAVDRSLAHDAPERTGQAVFVKNCLACHRLNGAGNTEMGPDLGLPMNVTQYMTDAGLRALIRDPKAVRTWPLQQMEGFSEQAISNAELDGLVSYLAYMGKRKPEAKAVPADQPAP
ncbi:cytochrome c [Hyphomicrobium sp.]|uniref:cytochrome c n=1 Tax=Hyphomicrobium sp. TaxID=82 RepID=UPI002D7926BC|nr:cytochrome c [Hyphomicrobium sp.]HET6388428.1 cytochrome c [Hyphomicrobium sp.]